MKTKSVLSLAGALVILAGATAILTIRTSPSGEVAANSAPAANTRESRGAGFSASQEDPRQRRDESRGRDTNRFSQLVEKYGESRTNLSKHVAGEMAGLIDEVRELHALARKQAGSSASLGNPIDMLGEGAKELALTEEQETRAAALLQEYEEKMMNTLGELSQEIKKNPAPVMDALLAGDALSLGKISEKEYRQRVEGNEALPSFLDPQNMLSRNGQSAFSDDQFVRGFRDILDARQQEAFDSVLTQEAGNTPGKNNAPAMATNLEHLSDSIGSIRKITSGARTMLEGAGGLNLGF